MKNSEFGICNWESFKYGNKTYFTALCPCFPISRLPNILHSAFLTTIFFVLAILIYPAISLSQGTENASNPRLKALFDRNSAKVGSRVTLTLNYHLPDGAHLSKKLKVKGLENLSIIDRSIGPNQIKIELMVDQIGSLKTGRLALDYLDKDGKNQTMVADHVSLSVLSNLGGDPAKEKLRPIQGIIPTRTSWRKYLPWAAGLLGMSVILVGLASWFKKSRGRRTLRKPEDPPHIRARKEIENLEARGLFEKGYAKEFYFLFSKIIRRYLESMRGFSAAEFTTEEIAQHIDNEQDRMLIPLLQQADLVKFANAIPTKGKKENEIKTSLSYIQKTSPDLETGHLPDFSRDTHPITTAIAGRSGVAK